MLRNCTDSDPTLCWPCEAGFWCANGTKTPCGVNEWSGGGAVECAECRGTCERKMMVRECTRTSDRVCVECPEGYGCDNGDLVQCKPGTRSENGTCVDTADACEGVMVANDECRPCPPGYRCSMEEGISLCAENTYSLNGQCVSCVSNSESSSGSRSEDDCMCVEGYVKTGSVCSACKAGTVFKDGQCVLCTAGEYCLGKTHHEPCPIDMFSHRGAAVCLACMMNAGCLRNCVDQSNCTCDDGYVDVLGECRRCAPGTRKDSSTSCVPCEAGFECAGGPDVRMCDIATFSVGNQSKCTQCSKCSELTVSRCNATHDSVCEKTALPLAVITLYQHYKTEVDGETFAMFAMVYASSLPKAQLLRVCDELECVQCFQGVCPVSKMPRLGGPKFSIVIEIRAYTTRLFQNVESLSSSNFLQEQAKTTMAKITDAPFTSITRVEQAVICPGGADWDGGMCIPKPESNSARTWLGVSVVLMCMLAVFGRERERVWKRVAGS